MTSDARLYVQVLWDRPEYHGLREDGSVDWPPSPMRLLGALTAGAYAMGDPQRSLALAALDKVMGAPPPLIYASRKYDLALPATYAQKSGLDAESKGNAKHVKDFLDLSLVRMDTGSRILKPVDGVSLDAPVAVFEIEVVLSCDELAALTQAAGHIGYFGRSSDPAGLDVTVEPPMGINNQYLRRLVPIPTTTGKTRGWTPWSGKWLQSNHKRMFGGGQLPLPPIPATGYVQPLRYGLAPQSETVQILEVARSIPSPQVPRFLRALQKELPSDLSGGVSSFPLINAGHQYGDGRCLGLGFTSIDRGEKTASRHEILAVASEVGALLSDEPLNKYQTGPVPQESSRTLQEWYWERKALEWVSATPYRGFPDQMVVEHVISTEAQRRFGIGVEILGCSPNPRYRWEHRWKQDLFADGLMDWWIRLRVPEAIEGPLMLHDNQSLGTGLFVPFQVDHHAQDRTDSRKGQMNE